MHEVVLVHIPDSPCDIVKDFLGDSLWKIFILYDYIKELFSRAYFSKNVYVVVIL